MKKLLLISAIAFSLFASSCGSQKAAITPYSDAKEATVKRVKIEKEECQIEAEDKSDFLRGYGIGTSGDQMMARDLASAAARNEIVNAIQVSASSMLKKYNMQHSSDGGGAMTYEDKGKAERAIKSVAEETLNGARIICSNTYMVGQKYEYHVCIELTGVDYAKKVYNKLANQEKLIIDYNAQKFGEDMNKELEEYRKRKQGL